MGFQIGVNNFLAQLRGGGARTNLFMAEIQFPAIIAPPSDIAKAGYLCNAAELPSSDLGVATVSFQGRDIPLVGDRGIEPWTATFTNDTDFDIRGAFERWHNAMIGVQDNVGLQDPSSYMVSFPVHSLDRNGDVIYTYVLHNAWAGLVSSIGMSHSAKNTVQEFSVTFNYTHWTSPNAQDGTGLNIGI